MVIVEQLTMIFKTVLQKPVGLYLQSVTGTEPGITTDNHRFDIKPLIQCWIVEKQVSEYHTIPYWSVQEETQHYHFCPASTVTDLSNK